MARNLQVITVADQVIKISQLPTYTFVKLEGGKVEKELGEYGDGVSRVKRYTTTGVVSFPEITISKPYDILNDIALTEKLDEMLFKGMTVEVVQSHAIKGATDYDAGEIIFTYKQCSIKSYTPPTYDSIGSDVAMLEVVLQPGDIMPGRGRIGKELSDDAPDFKLNTSLFDQMGLFDIF